MMRKIIIILFAVTSALMMPAAAPAQGHIFRGKLVNTEGYDVSSPELVFPLTKDTIRADSSGILTIDIAVQKNRLFYGHWLGWNSKIYRFNTAHCADTVYIMTVPGTAFYTAYERKGICPVTGHKNHLIPIVYSLPSKAMMKQARAGNIILGGCVPAYNAAWYCRLHDFRF